VAAFNLKMQEKFSFWDFVMGAHATLLADCRASAMPAPRHGSQPRAAPTRIPDDHLASRDLQPRNSSVAGL
jgi:hypothetical protein